MFKYLVSYLILTPETKSAFEKNV